jgi:DNA end-binding protein Ku
MAERPVWRGHLRLALVSCPVALHPAHAAHNELHFHFVNPDTGNRVRMVTLDAQTDQELSRRDLQRGFEFRKDHYLVLTDDDFESVRIESSEVLNVEKFVPNDAIDPLYFDTAYYLVPDGDAGQDVYVVLREAIARTRRLALSRVVIARRERTVAIRPLGRGLVAHTLHDASEVHDPDELFAQVPPLRPEASMVQLAVQLVDRQTGKFAPADMQDRYAARLRALIEAKLKGEGLSADPEPVSQGDNVIDLMAALKRSLGADAKPAAKKAPAKKVASKPAKKPAARRRA